jgi:hypothetical protein
MSLLQKWIPRSAFFKLMSFYPPYLGAGIRVAHVSHDFRSIRVEMGLRFWNRNYVGTQFGGSLYSMVDPFFMLMAMENLGRGYIVWDKASTIRFKKPGTGLVYAEMRLEESQLQEIRAAVEREGKCHPTFLVQIFDREGTLIAEVDKVLSVRTKKKPTILSGA